ncbi:helix-turn-helix domain-containing protein [Streptomyces sp. NBC_01410]|uniref:helix-turn-helix transcriptional regulator n=1 Tax=Streptomyces sp. NBC_01410 TaxID=2903856 RepID=UPI00324B6F40
MEHTADTATPVDTLRKRVKELRGRAGLTGADLADRLARLGVNWNRSIVANFEAGRRPNVSVVEWLALAQALDVAPLHLLVSPDATDADLYQVTPTRTAAVPVVREWIRGYYPLNADPARFEREAPRTETVSVSLGEMGYQVTLDRSPASMRALEQFIRTVSPGATSADDKGEGA